MRPKPHNAMAGMDTRVSHLLGTGCHRIHFLMDSHQHSLIFIIATCQVTFSSGDTGTFKK